MLKTLNFLFCLQLQHIHSDVRETCLEMNCSQLIYQWLMTEVHIDYLICLLID